MNADRSAHPVAVLVFSHSAAHEAERKRFVAQGGVQANRRIAQQLIRQTRRIVKKSGLPSYYFFTEQQQGDHFGERLANSLEAVFAQGHQKVLILGNDCRDLSAAELQKAAQMLQEKDWVLGPDTDGGLYLIGINQKHYQRAAFQDLPWESPQLCEAFAYGLAESSCEWLALRSDIDNGRDLADFLSESSPLAKLSQAIRAILAAIQGFVEIEIHCHFLQIPLRQLSLRAPPLAC